MYTIDKEFTVLPPQLINQESKITLKTKTSKNLDHIPIKLPQDSIKEEVTSPNGLKEKLEKHEHDK